ncbi:MAG: pre-peptidase C-terminal domain-containing protein [Gemmatimonadota bacterium]
MNRQTIAVLTCIAILGACSDNGVETISVADITVSGYSVPLTPSQTLQLSAQALGRSGQQLNGHTFTWTSSNNTIATVTPTGLVTAMAQGSVTIVATTAGVSGEVTISVSDPCSTVVAHTTGSTVNGTLSIGDCRLDNFLTDLYSFTLPGPQVVTLNLTTAQFDAYLELRDNNNNTVAFNDDLSETSTNARLRVIAPSGTYRLLVKPFSPSETGGTYTLNSVAASTINVANCEEIWLIRPPASSFVLNENITTADCLDSGYYSDLYAIYIRAGQQVTLSMNATFDTYLTLFNSQGIVVAENDDIDDNNRNSRIGFTATSSGAYYLDASSFDVGTTGTYTLMVMVQ